MEESGYIQCLKRYMEGATSSQEEAELREWLLTAESADACEAFYRKRWLEAAESSIVPDVQQRMLAVIRHKMAAEEKPVVKPSVSGWRRWIQYAAAAAVCICVGLGIGIGTERWTSSRLAMQAPAELKTYTITANKGQRAQVTLPDGSEVWLNSHTRLSYTNEYGVKDRKVKLTGEAFFEVAKDPANRFLVQAGEMQIEALGTSFNVKAYEEDKDITATLFTGSVKTSVGNKAYTLAPNQYASYNRTASLISAGESEDAAHARMWLNNELAFDGQTMAEIAVLLNRMSNVQVVFTSEKVKRYRFSGVIKNNSLDNIIELISLTAPITYQSRGDTIILSEKP